MSPIQIRSLSDTSNEEILDCFNISFSEYFIPFQLTLEQLVTKLDTESVDKSISVGAFKDHKLIGFVLHGSRILNGVYRAYNAGTGVIPEERGKAITRNMYEFIRPVLSKKGFQEVFLEVISTNIPALRSYQKIGFEERRRLSCFKGKPSIPKVVDTVTIKEENVQDVTKLPQFGEMEPTWQNSRETILKLGDSVRYFLAFQGDTLCGYGILNGKNHRILEIAVKKEFRNQQIGTNILHGVHDKISEPISMINVDHKAQDVLRFFEHRNLKKTLEQIEMRLKIGNDRFYVQKR